MSLAVRLPAPHRRLHAVCRAGGRAVLIRDVLTVGTARQVLQVADMVFGISAGSSDRCRPAARVLFREGRHYYFHTWTFIAKLTLFMIIGLVSIIPTREFLSWRKAVKQGQAPSVEPGQDARVALHHPLELAGVVLIILMAALMAKGVGLML